MKNSMTLVALAAGLGQVAATGFHNAPIFQYPGNTDNKCIDKQVPGFSWDDLDLGDFTNYGGFNWGGFKCESKFSKRDNLMPRTFQDKCITGSATNDKKNSPSFSCDSTKGLEKASIKQFYVTPEFDCDLEFHYDMPDGSTCKHRSACQKAGTIVKNSQCGGAKGVTIVYPSQSAKPKPTCAFGFHSIDFDCNSYSTQPPKTTTSSSSKSTSVPVSTTSATSAHTTSVHSSYSLSVPSSTKATTSSTVKPSSSYPASSSATSTTSEVKPSSYSAGPSTSTTTSEKPSTTSSTKAESSSVYSASSSTKVESSSTKAESSSVYSVSSSTSSSAASSSTTPGYPVEQQPSTTTFSSTKNLPVSSSTSSSAGPIETLPCPDVVPSCLNTFLTLVGNCKDNTDTACFCPNAEYVQTIFDCIYAHGQTDDIISEAISYFQGICASHCDENPAIVTGADTITKVITVTATPITTAVYTTVYVDATTVVACNGDDGKCAAGSSTTVVVSTTITVPQVGFATVTGEATTSVAVVPGGNVATATATQTGYPTTLLTTPVGTGSRTVGTSTRTSATAVVTAGAAHIRSGLGLVGLAAMAVAAF